MKRSNFGDDTAYANVSHAGKAVSSICKRWTKLSIQGLAGQVLCNFWFPSIAVRKELFFVIKQFFVSLRCILVVRALDNGIDRTSFLTLSAVYALRHVYVVTCRTSRSVWTRFSLNCNGLCGTNCFAELACNTTLLAGRVSSKRMFPTKSRRKSTFLHWII